MNLIIKPACRVQVIKERSIRRTSPEIHICNFEIAPDCTMYTHLSDQQGGGMLCDLQWHVVYVSPPLCERNPMALSGAIYSGYFLMKSRVALYFTSPWSTSTHTRTFDVSPEWWNGCNDFVNSYGKACEWVTVSVIVDGQDREDAQAHHILCRCPLKTRTGRGWRYSDIGYGVFEAIRCLIHNRSSASMLTRLASTTYTFWEARVWRKTSK
jgi:hypothetical protein